MVCWLWLDLLGALGTLGMIDASRLDSTGRPHLFLAHVCTGPAISKKGAGPIWKAPSQPPFSINRLIQGGKSALVFGVVRPVVLSVSPHVGPRPIGRKWMATAGRPAGGPSTIQLACVWARGRSRGQTRAQCAPVGPSRLGSAVWDFGVLRKVHRSAF